MSAYELELIPPDTPGTVVVALAGELDLTNARDFEERLERSATEPESRLVVDLNRVVFIDSAALHVLFRLARRRGDRFAIRFDPGARVARALEIVGVADAMTIESSAARPPTFLDP